MAVPATVAEFLEIVHKSGLLNEKTLAAYVKHLRHETTPAQLAEAMIRDGLLTNFQVHQFLRGRYRGLLIGSKYKILEFLGSGGMASVYLCEHLNLRRRVALKVLPTSTSQDPSALERFYREARAIAAVDHANVVRIHDLDRDHQLHYLVMEYADGNTLQQIVSTNGPMDILRAAHYIRQAAAGLQSAHEAGLVHRDIKPANLLLDRHGVVKVLDLGLARFFHDEDDNITRKYDETVLGTADYLAPEQAIDSNVDIRADIYSLGGTFYFLLTGRSPFGEGSVSNKLIWHQTRMPKAIRSLRQDVPEGLAAVIARMMSKDAPQRYQVPSEVEAALVPWTASPIPPPSEKEMPSLSPAARGLRQSGSRSRVKKAGDPPSGKVSRASSR